MAIYNGDLTITESRVDCNLVVDCPATTDPGVVVWPFLQSSLWTAKDWAIARVSGTSAQRDTAVDKAAEAFGSPYNWGYPFAYRSLDDKFYCSQLVWWAYFHAGIELDSPGPYNALGETAVPPDDIYWDDSTVVVKQRTHEAANRKLKRAQVSLIDGALTASNFAGTNNADLYLTDPAGRHTGVDPETGLVVNEIPGVYYSGPSSTPEIITITDLDGQWKIDVSSTTGGQFALRGKVIDPESPSTSEVLGNVEDGQSITYQIEYPADEGSLDINEVVPEPPTPTATVTPGTATPMVVSPTSTASLAASGTGTQTATPPPASPPADARGDANCDGKIDGADVVAVLKHAGNLSDAECAQNADVNRDQLVTASDAILILKYWAGIEDFPDI